MIKLNSILATFPEWGQKVPPLSLLFEENQKESQFLIFDRDVFGYNKSTKELEISKKYHI